MLTAKQKELLLFVHTRINDTGVPPSFDEMKDALDLKSKSGIHRLITALVERGFIHRLPHRARALEVLKLPENAGGAGGRKKTSRSSDEGLRAVSVPLMGRIAAGTPISAIQIHTRDIACPPEILTEGEHFALEVKGDSMIAAGIHEHDIVILKRCQEAETGDIVVALVANEEATLKRLRKKGATVALEAANPEFPTQTFPAHQVEIQGRLVGLVRRY